MSGMFSEVSVPTKQKSVEWYTPAWIFDELAIAFDTDPCSPHDHPSMVPASNVYTVFDDGLAQDWRGKVWLNPPYGKTTSEWIHRLIDHGNGIALVFSRTDSVWFQQAMKNAHSILFMSGRIAFIAGHENKHKRSRSGAGSAMIAFGSECGTALKRMKRFGMYIEFEHQEYCDR